MAAAAALTINGTLTNSSTNNNGLYIGNTIIGSGDTVTATGLINTGVIQIVGNGTIQSTLDITSGAAGFGTLGVETGTVVLSSDALLEFASGQIGTIAGELSINGINAGSPTPALWHEQRAGRPYIGHRGLPPVERSVG